MEVQSDQRDFKGVWIPKDIWLNKELNVMQKLFLVEIDSLDNDAGCYASNKYFSEFFGVSKGRCTQIIKELEAKGLVTIQIEREGKLIIKRTLRVVNKLNRVVRKLNKGSENIKQGYLGNDEESNTPLNNSLDNARKEKKLTFGEFQKVKLTEDEYQSLIKDYGEVITKEYIQRLDEYMASTGKKYSSHKATMLSWMRKSDVKKGEDNKKGYRILT